MKTKKHKTGSYIKRHHQGLAFLFVSLLLFCMVRYQRGITHFVRQAYSEGFSIVGTYMRDAETIRYPVNLGISTRIQTISGQ